MIAKLKGRLDSTGTDHAIIDVGGVGYLVGASSRTLSALGPVGEAVTVHTEMLVSEDSIRLVGFARGEERDWFRLLISVQGVGSLPFRTQRRAAAGVSGKDCRLFGGRDLHGLFRQGKSLPHAWHADNDP